MIEGCDAAGEEVIALIDEGSLSDSQNDIASLRNNVENNEKDNLIPVIVCGKHFDKILEAYYSKSDPYETRISKQKSKLELSQDNDSRNM